TEPARSEREHLAAEDESLGRSRARSVAQVAARDLGRALPLGMRPHDRRRGERPDVGRDRDLAYELSEPDDLVPVNDPVDRRLLGAGGAVDDLVQLLEGRVADAQLEEEAIELGLGKRVGAL